MDLGQIDLAIEERSFQRETELVAFIEALKNTGGTAHLMGVVSDGGVHGHIVHVQAAIEAITAAEVPVVLHAITDGRDVAPDSAKSFIESLSATLPKGARIGTVIGRYWAMDRDNRWDRVERAFNAMAHAQGAPAEDAVSAVAASYEKGEMDEFIAPTIIADYAGMADGDGLFCLNFRADRAREILAAFGAPDFDGFEAARPNFCAKLGMVEYSQAHNHYMNTVFPPRELKNTLGAWVAQRGKSQFRLAETVFI